MRKQAFLTNVCSYSRYRDGKREEVPSTVASRKQLSDLLCENKENVLLAYLLHVTDEILGFALFSYGQPDISIYQTLSIHISAAISRIILLKGLTQYTKGLSSMPGRRVWRILRPTSCII